MASSSVDGPCLTGHTDDDSVHKAVFSSDDVWAAATFSLPRYRIRALTVFRSKTVTQVRGYLRIGFGVGLLAAAPIGLFLLIGFLRTIPVGALDGLVVMFVVLGTSRLGLVQFQQGKRLLLEAARHEMPLQADQDFVLYLRGFADDISTASSLGEPEMWAQVFANLVRLPLTEEEHLTRALGAYCQVLAIGSPDEEMPILGAKRMYISEADWREAVRQFMQRARFVVLRLGAHDGLLWELRTALRELPPERLALMVPATVTPYGRSIFALASERVRDVLKSELGTELPIFPEPHKPSPKLGTLRSIICFSSQRQPIVHQLSNRDVRRVARYPLADVLQDVFAVLLGRVGVKAPLKPLWFRRGVAYLIDFAIAAACVGIVAAALATREPTGVEVWIATIVLSAIGSCIAESLFQTTPGKRMVSLSVSIGDSKPGVARLSVRNIAKALALTVAILPAPWCYGGVAILATVPFTRRRAPLHDVISGVAVVGRSCLLADVLDKAENAAERAIA